MREKQERAAAAIGKARKVGDAVRNLSTDRAGIITGVRSRDHGHASETEYQVEYEARLGRRLTKWERTRAIRSDRRQRPASEATR